MAYEDYTHEELAAEGLREGRLSENGEMLDAARELLEAVDDEKPSKDLAQKVITLLRA